MKLGGSAPTTSIPTIKEANIDTKMKDVEEKKSSKMTTSEMPHIIISTDIINTKSTYHY